MVRNRGLAVSVLTLVGVVSACGGSLASPTSGSPAARSSGADAASSSTVGAAPSIPTTAASVPAVSAFELFGAIPTQPVDAATGDRLQAAIDRIAKAAPDAIAAVVSPAGTWAGAAGVDGPDQRPAKPTDEFAIASVTKTVTASLVLKLADEGKIDLHAPIANYVKSLGVDGNGATVEQVIGMKSGMGDTVQAFFDEAYAHCERTWTPSELVSTFGDPVGPAGTDHYSNPSYKLLGFAVEQVTGMPMADAFRSVLDPAGGALMMVQTAETKPPEPWALPIAGHNGDMALGDFGKGGALPCLGYASGSLSASGMASDAPSLARWAWALANGEIVSQERLTMMSSGYGLDDLSDLAPGAYGHSGTQPGYASVLALLPRERAVIVLFENDGDLDVVSSAGFLARALGG